MATEAIGSRTRFPRSAEFMGTVARKVPYLKRRIEYREKLTSARAAREEAYSELGGEDRTKVTQDQRRNVLRAETELVDLGEGSHLSSEEIAHLVSYNLGEHFQANPFFRKVAGDFELIAANLNPENEENRLRQLELQGRAQACKAAANF